MLSTPAPPCVGPGASPGSLFCRMAVMRTSRRSRVVMWVCVRSFVWRDVAEAHARQLRRRGIHAKVPVEPGALGAAPAARVLVPIVEQRQAEGILDSRLQDN